MTLVEMTRGGAAQATGIARMIVFLAFAGVGSLTDALIPMDRDRDIFSRVEEAHFARRSDTR